MPPITDPDQGSIETQRPITSTSQLSATTTPRPMAQIKHIPKTKTGAAGFDTTVVHEPSSMLGMVATGSIQGPSFTGQRRNAACASPSESATRDADNVCSSITEYGSASETIEEYARIVGDGADPRVAAENLSAYYSILQEEFERIRGRPHQILQPVTDDGWVMDGTNETAWDIMLEENACTRGRDDLQYGVAC